MSSRASTMLDDHSWQPVEAWTPSAMGNSHIFTLKAAWPPAGENATSSSQESMGS